MNLNKLRGRIYSAGFSVKSFAAKYDMDAGHLYKILNGHHPLTKDYKERILSALRAEKA